MIISKQVEIKWRTNNKDWYESKGYKFTKSGDKFVVNAFDLIPNSKIDLKFKCDYCKEEFIRGNSIWRRSCDESPIKKDACKKCVGLKRKESNLIIYGVENVMSVDEFAEKQKKTLVNNYGVEHPLQNADILAKTQETNISRYGGKSPANSPDVLEKMKQTTFEKYGVHSYLLSNEGKEKIKKTNLERYGYENVSQSPLIREKVVATLYKHGTMSTSSQQKHIHNLIGGDLNYPFSRNSLDIAFPNEKIYLEYDGGGHTLSVKTGKTTQEEFDKKEQRRFFYLLDNGWKEIRIISDDDKLPLNKDIVDFVDLAKSFFNEKKGISIRWNVDENLVVVNLKHKYTYDEFVNYYRDEEVI